VPQDAWIDPDTAKRLCELSREMGRQLGLLITRRGEIQTVIVGDAHQIFIPELGRTRGSKSRFRGLRLVLSQLRGEGITKDNLTDLSLLRLDAIVALQTDAKGQPGALEMAHLVPPTNDGGPMWEVEKRTGVHGWDTNFLTWIQDLEAQFTAVLSGAEESGRERAVLIGVATRGKKEAQLSIAELERLAHTAGLQVVDRMLQGRSRPDPRRFVGKGKLQDALLRCMHLGANVLIFDGELSPSQLRNVATDTELKVLDRTQLILDIFSIRAKTREGKLQVELAQLRYRRPRLATMSTVMSRLTGGIGGRGPGETKLEINRRRADERLKRIEKQLAKLGKDRALRRQRRKRVGLPMISIVGYTNAGKSTLLNRMTHSKVDAEDKLFATLDPTSRRMRFPRNREVILTDTVGFIRALPQDLVQAFRSTLEEVVEADLLLHVIDSGSVEASAHFDAVETVLKDLGVADTPQIIVLNKIDSLTAEALQEAQIIFKGYPCSALTGEGLVDLMGAIESSLFVDPPAHELTPETEEAL
jgi:GTP-binding protein HflX